jgi:hypothetical protein
MPILSFSLRNEVFGWKLNEFSLKDFNLLVGLSGVGKSNILRTLQMIRLAGTQQTGSMAANGAEWSFRALVEKSLYEWTAKVSVSSAAAFFHFERNGGRMDLMPSDMPFFIRETLVKDGFEIVSRAESGVIRFNGNEIPKLRKTDSVVSLLSNEPLVAPLFHFLNRILFTESASYSVSPQLLFVEPEMMPLQKAEEARAVYTDLDQLRRLSGFPLILKAYILQENFPDRFLRLKERYRDIFGTVTDVKIGTVEEMLPRSIADNVWLSGNLILGIKEEGIGEWVLGHLISDGMLRTLIHLFELEMLPPDSVVLVDEFENGLGINCLPALTNLFLNQPDKQFILTSHHPYVINNVPWEYWKLITRKGTEVTVKDVESIPSFDTKSLHNRFVLLTNLDEYQEAIQ